MAAKAASTSTLDLTFEPDRETKGTWRFAELVPGPLDEPKVGTLYVRKQTLAGIGYTPGDRLRLTLEVA
jgi:hypothetical protein